MSQEALVFPDISQSEPIEPTFTLFPRLPDELRLEIWKHALETPRLITISHEPCISYNFNRSTLPGPAPQVLPAPRPPTCPPPPPLTFRSPPHYPPPPPPPPLPKPRHLTRDVGPNAMLGANSESREEALKIYTQLPEATEAVPDLCTRHYGCKTKGVYVAPGDDVVFVTGSLNSYHEFLHLSLAAGGLRGSGAGSELVVGGIRRLAIEEGALRYTQDEPERSWVSPVVCWIMRDLSELESLFVVTSYRPYERFDAEKELDEGVVRYVFEKASVDLAAFNVDWNTAEFRTRLKEWVMPKLEVVTFVELLEVYDPYGLSLMYD